MNPEYWLVDINGRLINLAHVEEIYMERVLRHGQGVRWFVRARVARGKQVEDSIFNLNVYMTEDQAKKHLREIHSDGIGIVRLPLPDRPKADLEKRLAECQERLSKLEAIIAYAPPFGDFPGGDAFLESQSHFNRLNEERQ